MRWTVILWNYTCAYIRNILFDEILWFVYANIVLSLGCFLKKCVYYVSISILKRRRNIPLLSVITTLLFITMIVWTTFCTWSFNLWWLSITLCSCAWLQRISRRKNHFINNEFSLLFFTTWWWWWLCYIVVFSRSINIW